MGRTWVDNSVLDAGLSCQALALYMQIKRRMCGIADVDRNKYIVERDGKVCFSLKGVSAKELFGAAGISNNTFKKAMDELVKAGFIMVDTGMLNGAQRKTNAYYIPVSSEEFKGQEVEDVVVRAQTGGTRREDTEVHREPEYQPEKPTKTPTTRGFPKKSREQARRELETPAATPRHDIRDVIARERGYESHEDMVEKKEAERKKRVLRSRLDGIEKRSVVAQQTEWKSDLPDREYRVEIGVQI